MKTYNGIMVIGDVVLSNTRPGRRLDEGFSDLAFKKLEISLNMARDNNLKPIIIGSLTKKSFEISIYSRLISLLSSRNILIIAGENEYRGAGTLINPHSTAKLLSESGIVDLAEESHVHEKIIISTDVGNETVCLLTVPERLNAPANIGINEGVNPGEKVILLSKSNEDFALNEETSAIIAKDKHEWPGCDLFITEKSNPDKSIDLCGRTTWLSTGPLVRHQIEHEPFEPCVWICRTLNSPEKIVLEHERHVFDMEGFVSDAVQKSYDSSEFTAMLKEESIRAQEEISDDKFLEKELSDIYSKIDTPLEAREIITNLMNQTNDPASALTGVF